MDTSIGSKTLLDMPYMVVNENMIEEINSLFLELTGYEEINILGRDVREVWKQLLRINIDREAIKHSHEADCYLFDIYRNVKEVTVRFSDMVVSEKSIYTFRQKKNLMFEEKYPFLESVNSGNSTGVSLYSVPDMVLLKANDDYFEHYNKIYKSKKDILGLTLADLIPGGNKEEINSSYMNMIKSDRPLIFKEQRVEFPGFGVRYINFTLTPVFEEGSFKYIIQTHYDVTSEVEKRNEMEDLIKMKDEFIYLMSHEFKTPLTVINAAVQTLEYIYAGKIPEKAALLIDKVKQNVNRQLRLVDNMLDITRINAGQIKLKEKNIDIVYLTKSITESVAFYAQQKGVEMVFKSKFSQRIIGVDDEKFERILLNLLSNAIKFTPKGKKVIVELSARMDKKRRVICIKVIDQGVGIPKEKQSQIFKRFVQVDSLLTRQAEGSGIGLHLVKLMADAFGGDISMESESGKGSIFTLMIPSRKVKNRKAEIEHQEAFNKRIIQSIATELSDIYF